MPLGYRWFMGTLCVACLMSTLFSVRNVFAAPIQAKERQGAAHGFLLVKTLEGKVLATGDLECVNQGDQVRSRLTFHFRDGSIDDEVTVYRQKQVFRLISDHHIQRGPSFPQPIDVAVNASKHEVQWRETKSGKEEVKSEHKDLPDDLANGLITAVLENYPIGTPEITVSYLAGDSKPHVVRISIKPAGKASFYVGGVARKAKQFTLHVEIGGVAGAIAPLIGKQPTDKQIWVMEGEVPTFLKMEGALYNQGPIWVTELAAPVWPRQ